MTDDPFEDSDPELLANFMKFGAGQAQVWRRDETESLLEHQLSAPILPELGSTSSVSQTELKELIASVRGDIRSFRDLLRHNEPPLELLRMASEYFRSLEDEAEVALPTEVARAMSAANVAKALAKYRARITELSDDAVKEECEWVLAQPWVEETIRSVCRQGLAKLTS